MVKNAFDILRGNDSLEKIKANLLQIQDGIMAGLVVKLEEKFESNLYTVRFAQH